MVKKTKEQREQEKLENENKALKEINYILEAYKLRDWLTITGKRGSGHFREINFIYEDKEQKKFLLRKLQYEFLLKELNLKEVTYILNDKPKVQGFEGQDRKNYTDNQDRENYITN